MSHFIFEFFSVSILMGLAIGLDAAIATSIKADAMGRPGRAFTWLAGISLTHTLFPMVGYLMSYFGLQKFPIFTPVIGVVAFALIAHYLYDEFKNLIDDKQESDNDASYLISLGLVLAVSWDALWSGPAKSAQVIDWPVLAVWTSFLVVGLTVASLSTLAFYLSRRLVVQQNGWSSNRKAVAQWIQLSAISYFGWLALCRYTLGFEFHGFSIFLYSFISMGVMLQLLVWNVPVSRVGVVPD